MPYALKESDGSHRLLGQSAGNRVDEQGGSFWITGWPAATQQQAQVGAFYTLVLPDGHANSVEVLQAGGQGMGGIRFRFTG